jgi:tRNA (cytidine/uridine-2'-O-)-methyltransferase
MFHIVLYEPEIAPNTGNIIRLCANTGASLHLIHPLGFELDDRRLRRAGLDYHEFADVHQHEDLAALFEEVPDARLFAFSTRASTLFNAVNFRPGDMLLFGPETRGLPPNVLQHVRVQETLRIPMKKGSRSLNLSNAVAICLYEAWGQNGFFLGN